MDGDPELLRRLRGNGHAADVSWGGGTCPRDEQPLAVALDVAWSCWVRGAAGSSGRALCPAWHREGLLYLLIPAAPTSACKGHSSREPDRGCVSLRVPWLVTRVSPPPSELGWLKCHNSQSGVDWVAAL